MNGSATRLWTSQVNQPYSYFSIEKDLKTANEWIRNQFVNKSDQSILSLFEEKQLVVIANNSDVRSLFETTLNLFALWVKVIAEYPDITTKALKALLPFPTTYLCEAAVFAL